MHTAAVACAFFPPCVVEKLQKGLAMVLQPSGGTSADWGHQEEKSTF